MFGGTIWDGRLKSRGQGTGVREQGQKTSAELAGLERFQDRYTLSALLRGRRSLGSRRLECIPFGYGNPETAIAALRACWRSWKPLLLLSGLCCLKKGRLETWA
jgi:hypothetical protein